MIHFDLTKFNVIEENKYKAFYGALDSKTGLFLGILRNF